MNENGSDLVYSTFFCDRLAMISGIAVDNSGNAYVTGHGSGFAITSGAFDTSFNGLGDVFVAELNASGSGLVYSTCLGGSEFDYATGIAVDGSGNAYVIGSAGASGFPVTSGAFDTSFDGQWYDHNKFVTKLNASGTGLVYSTYLGGSDEQFLSGIAVDNTGNVYVTGYTASSDYPVTSGAFDTSFSGGENDAFVTKLNESGSALVYSTFLGGSSKDNVEGIALDGSGNVYVTGYTTSTDYPVSSGAFDTSFNGRIDAFVTKLNASGSALDYSTFLGGSGYDYGHGIAVDGSGNAYVTGETYLSDYPVTNGAFDTSTNGKYNAFVTKLNMAPNGPLTVTAPNGGEYWTTGTTRDITWTSDGYTESPVKIELFRDRGATFDRTIVSSTPNTGSYAWTIPTDILDGSDYRIRISYLGDSTIWDHNDGDFEITYKTAVIELPSVFTVSPPYPNPFNPRATIEYSLPKDVLITLEIYNISGQKVATVDSGRKSAGKHSVVWDARGLPSGVYFYTLRAEEYVKTGKALLMK